MALASPGDVVLFKFPQTDLAVGKLRPALVVTSAPSRFDDWLVCMLSTQTQQAVLQFDEIIDLTDSDFGLSGLKAASLIRVTRVAVVSEDIFVGTLGAISTHRLDTIRTKIAEWITDG